MTERPYISFAEVKEKVPIPEALEALGIAGQFERRGDTLSGVCPLAAHKHGPRPNAEQFKINRRDGLWLWHCFGDCGRGGDVIELVKELTGYDNAHVRFWFAEQFGDRLSLGKPNGRRRDAVSASRSGDETEARDSVETPEPLGANPNDRIRSGNGKSKRRRPDRKKARGDLGQEDHPRAHTVTSNNLSDAPELLKPLRFRLNLDPAVPYLQERGLTPETIERYGLGLCRRGVLKDYVAMPVFRWPGEDGENPLGYLGRWPGDDHDDGNGRPRYKWPDGFPRNRVVYGMREALAGADGQPLVVVEGPFKVYHLVQKGFPAVVATFGASLSDEQAEILAATCRPIVLMFDGDEAGRAGAEAAAGKLAARAFVRVISLSEDMAPDDLSAEQLAEYLA